MSNTPDPTPEGTQDSLPEVTLEELPGPLREATGREGWTKLMPVQAKGIPYLLAGRDMMVQARTGSGKTGAFLLPMLERLDPSLDRCQALVLVPTRELAKQVTQVALNVFDGTGLRTVPVYGGVGYGPQNEGLRGGAQLVVGTPGRVLDHLLRRTFNLDDLAMLVFDEADRMMSMGFYPDMKEVQRYLPRREILSSMFSATYPASVKRTANQFLRSPEFLSLSSDHVHVTDTEHVYYTVDGMDKDRSLIRLIEIENPASALIFCNTKVKVHYVTVVLQRFGYDADELSSDLSQAERERVLGKVRRGALRFLVATDVASRGLDIRELSHVVLYEPPEDIEDYIHRAGRTGRAGAPGVAISLVSPMEELELFRIARNYGIDLQKRTAPTDADVEAVVAERVTALLEADLRRRDKLKTERSLRFVPLARSLAENEEESAVIAMLLDEYYQKLFHAPLPGPSDEPRPEKDGPPKRGRGRREKRKRRR
ncbi:MAG: DEAD/DEAH box helicase [Planctomycetota bacterium]